MALHIDRNALSSNNITLNEFLLMLEITEDFKYDQAESALISKGYITKQRDNNGNTLNTWKLTSSGIQAFNTIIIESESFNMPADKISSIAIQLKELFPKGKKDGTNYYWTDSIPLIVRRLKLFFKKYGDNYTEDQIITATKNYIEGFNGSYQYMKLLKYFIFKEKKGAAGDIESESELLSYIENAGQENELNNNWTDTLI